MTAPRALLTGTFLALLLCLPAAHGGSNSGREERLDVREQIRFGAEMAEKGNWREAIFRWKRVLETDPHNPRLHNNLAVAYETLGEYEMARQAYKEALKYDPRRKEIRRNYALFKSFYKSFHGRDNGHGDDDADGEANRADELDRSVPAGDRAADDDLDPDETREPESGGGR